MHVNVLKFYLELTVAFAYEDYQTETRIGNPGKQISFGNRWAPQQKEAASGNKKRDKKWGGKRKKDKTSQVLKETERKNRQLKSTLTWKKKKEAIKDLKKGTGLYLNMELITNWELSLEMKQKLSFSRREGKCQPPAFKQKLTLQI